VCSLLEARLQAHEAGLLFDAEARALLVLPLPHPRPTRDPAPRVSGDVISPISTG